MPVKDIAPLSVLRADAFIPAISRPKDFYWQTTGVRDYHLVLDDNGDQIFFAITDGIAEHVRKVGGTNDPL